MASPRYPKPGTVVLGKYRVESVIGEGGMGAVMKGYHIDLEEPVAIKVLLPEMLGRQDIVQRFLREAKAAVKLKGEHVARVIDVGRLDADVDGNFEGVPYIVMEYLEGSDLNRIVKAHGPQDPAMAADLMLQACQAIAEAHAIGIIHRDIKASNFFIIQHDDDPPHLKVLDFGIATTPKGTSELTDGGQIIGTPSYMAPEQMRSSRLADARSDVWSMGVVLYELLEGKRPFRAEQYSDLCLKVGGEPPEPMVNREAPAGLRAVVMKCLEKPVERRYQSVAELAFDLMPFASDAVLARASVEQIARMLGRRGTRTIDAARVPDDATLLSGAPPRMTPQPYRAVSETETQPMSTGPDSSSQSKPGDRAPTSINGSAGEIAGTVKTPRRGLVLAMSFMIALALAGGGVLLFAGGSDQPSSSAARPAKQPEPVEDNAPVVEPVAEPVKPAEPSNATPVEPAAAEPTKVEEAKVEPVTVDATSSAAAEVTARTAGTTTKPSKKKIVIKKKKPDDVYSQRR